MSEIILEYLLVDALPEAWSPYESYNWHTGKSSISPSWLPCLREFHITKANFYFILQKKY